MRPKNTSARQLLLPALRRGPANASQLARELGVSGRTVLRLLQELDGQTWSAGVAGRTRHALLRALRGATDVLPLYAVSEEGKPSQVTELRLIEPAGCCCRLDAAGWPVDDASRDGWWPGLPYVLYDMQPQGYLGRRFARVEHRSLEVPEDPRNWSDDDIVFVLSRRGADSAGNLIFGEAALRLWQEDWMAPAEVLTDARLPQAYLSFAQESVAAGIAGSSAAGEFPKFLALRERASAATPHVIVKFSGIGEASQRWSDLLVCEHLALGHAAGLEGVAVACSRLIQAGGRCFMESERFDRVGRFGRRPVVSLSALDGHLLGLGGSDWRRHARMLAGMGMLGAEQVATVERLWWYGRLIANSDMHLGNLGFMPDGAGRLRLAPAYDMLPMAYAPLAGGEVPAVEWRFEPPLPDEAEVWRAACAAALSFWREAGRDARISAEFRALCQANEARLAALAERV
ncbi:MAG: type II toxin-antitoxin system HipA family toxin YjjJ [Zoogloea sp.]|nr:type II toxin-antitoxin system HipA family toxin YjjJ [Zoogloea sp.]